MIYLYLPAWTPLIFPSFGAVGGDTKGGSL
ncbi:uncharacterized protein METZ01_LOCUS130127 [marine metagenome]|uniref:Uncharacterized protein n=1 Tax=marine metagenome TaxID=408172 RepID=A0A381YL90_9ZZZZ